LSGIAGISLGRAHALATFIAQEVRRIGAPIEQLTPLGGLRRYAPSVEHVSLLAVAEADAHGEVFNALAGMGGPATVLNRSRSRIALVTERGPVEVHLATSDSAGVRTGVVQNGVTQSRHRPSDQKPRLRHRLRQRQAAARRQHMTCATEEELYEYLGLAYVPPELREGTDELDLAERDALPALVTPQHIKGDLHTHTSWSDGRDSVEQMVQTAHGLGYEYLAITDHSERSAAQRTLGPGTIARQRADIDAAREHAPGLDFLHGVEVEIMPDGRLDFDDGVLAQFDIVLASLHDGAGHDGRPPARPLPAGDRPPLRERDHPSRQPDTRRPPGYDLDFDRLFEAAARSGTAVEVDGSPNHLDLDGALARRATASGAMLTIDSDAHRHDALGRQLQFGVGTARRGWVQPEQVLNTRGASAVRAFVAAKRPAGPAARRRSAPTGSAASRPC
jgi:DNA polymerase (family 10)